MGGEEDKTYTIPTGGDVVSDGAVTGADAGGTQEGDITGGLDFGGMDMETFIAGIIAGQNPTPQETGETAPQPITGEGWYDRAWGIDQEPGDYTLYPSAAEEEASRTMYESGRPRGAPTSRNPKYSTQDPLNVLNAMSTAELAALELQFIEAGFIDEDDYLGGQRGPLIADFGSLMVQADHNRIGWEDQLDKNIIDYQEWKKDNPEKVPLTWAQANPFIAPVEVKPDYATLAQGSKATMRQMLGRTPTSSEMKLLTAQLGSDYHAEWQTEVYDKSKMSWEAASRAHEAEATSGATGSVQGIDPEARFAERFEDRYENELEHRERVDTSERKSANLFGSIDTISRMTS